MARRLAALVIAGGLLTATGVAITPGAAAALGARSVGCSALNGQNLTASVINVNPYAFKKFERVDLQATGPVGDTVTVAVNGAVVATAPLPASISYYIPADGTYRFRLADTLGQATAWHSNCYPGPYPTSIGILSNVAFPVAGQPITFTANLAGAIPGSPPTGSVSFYVDGSATAAAVVPVVDAAASFTHAFTTGEHTVAAAYNGDAYDSPTSDTQFLTIGESGTSTTLTATPAVQAAGQPVVLSGTAAATAPGTGTPTGRVTILNRGTPIAVAVLANGSYSTSVSTSISGSYTLHAVYTGDANYAPSLSSDAQVTIQT